MPKPRIASLFAVLAILGTAPACVSGDLLPRDQAPTPTFDAIAFFSGRTEGSGILKIAMHHAQRTSVEGDGRVSADGSIILDQTVRRGDRSLIHRRWRLRTDSPGHYVGTLSDAVGPVVGIVDGNRLYLAFSMKGRLKAVQWLYLEPNGQTAHNFMIVRKAGIPVARLDETITRIAS